MADIGTGSGHAINVMAKAFPASRFTGIDFSDEGLAVGRAEAQRLGLANATFVAKDVAALDASETYDVITVFDAIHDQAQPAKVLENIYRALRPGGVLLMVDIKASTRLEDNIGVPLATYLYTVSTMHCMSVSLGLDGAGLGTCWGHQLATSMLADAGFGEVTVNAIETRPVQQLLHRPQVDVPGQSVHIADPSAYGSVAMGSHVDGDSDLLLAARAAYLQRDWLTCYEHFARAGGDGRLGTDDLDAQAIAAWRLGRCKESVRLAEQVFKQLSRSDPSAAAMKAVDVALAWLTRGDLNVGQGWMNRARRLLDGAPANPAIGYLAYLDAYIATIVGDTEALARQVETLRELSARLDTPAMLLCAWSSTPLPPSMRREWPRRSV